MLLQLVMLTDTGKCLAVMIAELMCINTVVAYDRRSTAYTTVLALKHLSVSSPSWHTIAVPVSSATFLLCEA
jgi:hypothetical protein